MKNLNRTLLASAAAFAFATSAFAQTAATPQVEIERDDQGRIIDERLEDVEVDVERVPSQSLEMQGGRVVVRQGEPRVTVEQDNPQVVVDQARPEVTVEQPEPVITVQTPQPTVNVQQQAPIVTVEQAQPVVTVRIPEPIVTVRLPKPEVDVNTSEPRVAVETPKPIVRFMRPEPRIEIQEAQPIVNVEEAQAEVAVNEAEGAEVKVEQAEASVEVEQAEPQVNVSRAEPQVQVQQAGEARVNVEQADARVRVEDTGQAAVRVDAQQQTAAVARTNYDMDSAYLLTLKRSPFYTRTVSDIIGTDVKGANGEEIGDIEDIALRNGKVVAIMSVGGFLGLGDHEVAMPLENMTMQGDDIVVNMTEEQVEALDEYDYRSVTALPRRRTIEYAVTRR